MRSLICGILKNGTNELIYKTEPVTDVENELMVTKRKRWGGGLQIRLELRYTHYCI